jgi:hypothetical protein
VAQAAVVMAVMILRLAQVVLELLELLIEAVEVEVVEELPVMLQQQQAVTAVAVSL